MISIPTVIIKTLPKKSSKNITNKPKIINLNTSQIVTNKKFSQNDSIRKIINLETGNIVSEK